MTILSRSLEILCAALLIEVALGYPDRLFRAIGHPVVWIGWLIGWLDRMGNRDTRASGVVALAVLVTAAVGPASLLQGALPWGVSAVLASSLLAQRSLWSHVAAVADGLDAGGLAEGRAKVAMIVGRDTAVLDTAGVVRAAIESLAENFSDGVVAPALWCGLGGLPGIALYKAVNTADSMIGHRTPRHARFGWAAARLDDVINLPASRLSVLWILAGAALCGGDVRGAARAVWRDAGRHRSPNAGWPEAAMAGALGLRLAGPRVYGAVRVEDGWMGDGRAEATVVDLRRALGIYRAACGAQLAVVVALAVLIAV